MEELENHILYLYTNRYNEMINVTRVEVYDAIENISISVEYP